MNNESNIDRSRCNWVGNDELLINYHDNEYGVSVHDDNVIYERLSLEIFQAGLNWKLILQKREGLNNAFHGFDIDKVAEMSDNELEKLRDNPEIIRNKLKIQAMKNNAKTIIRILEEFDNFLEYLKTLPYQVEENAKIELKEATKIMKKDGFKFIGPTILEEFFLSIGLNEVKHDTHCFLHANT